MGLLYVNSRGVAWRKHSYSAGNDFETSPSKYYLRRVLGWREKDNKARLRFGKALEEAIQFYHQTGSDGLDFFVRRWSLEQDKQLHYTRLEQNWETLNQIGQEMMRLYVIVQPLLPIPLGANSIFQREYSREVFPGDPLYGEIEDAGWIDIVAINDPYHPLLPTLDVETSEPRQLIVDIKTAAVAFPETPGLAAYDKQLRRYSWQSGIRDVALLWFQKCNLTLTKGCTATLLEYTEGGELEPGTEVIVVQLDDKGVWIVENQMQIEQMAEYQGRSNGRLDITKAAKARKQEWLTRNALLVDPVILTRQRIQFNIGRVSDESAEDAGQIAARQIIHIVNAWKVNKWPNTFGIRYPTDDTRDPYFRAFVLNDVMFQKENFEKVEEEAFNDLLTEEDADESQM